MCPQISQIFADEGWDGRRRADFSDMLALASAVAQKLWRDKRRAARESEGEINGL
jgi:hypothetical protein